ncbi:HD domain-containing protein [Aliiglaciecola sp. CAU 1673]|uniref:HD domain-containing protein n=1 Tax=Aliiglaciecola sp. CAU 1673 TaxID=3032595 RepID=UPI0023DCBCA5|nr:HD domain-containing protein [Aliiglaciecola sp. CAU 1673]MDF2177929.1 HD domain-containing protein [Aliiglaciecola sp. CAU 1673]
MNALPIDSLQPLLVDVPNYHRFMGRYFLTGLVTKADSQGQPCWALNLSDGSGDFKVYCNNPDLMAHRLQPHSMILVEAALRQNQGTAYYRCKNLLPTTDETTLGMDLSVLPRSFCSNPETFDALIVLASRLQHPLLRRFLRQVLLQQWVGLRFLQCPASLRHHHAYRGGLLQHSVEIAWDVAGVQELSTLERDIAVVAALLHDIGKTLTLTPDMTRTAIGELVDHSQLTLEICAEPLRALEQEAPKIAHQLRHAWTCYSPNARFGYKPQTRVARHVQRADRLSAKTPSNVASLPIFDDVTDIMRERAAN